MVASPKASATDSRNASIVIGVAMSAPWQKPNGVPATSEIGRVLVQAIWDSPFTAPKRRIHAEDWDGRYGCLLTRQPAIRPYCGERRRSSFGTARVTALRPVGVIPLIAGLPGRAGFGAFNWPGIGNRVEQAGESRLNVRPAQ